MVAASYGALDSAPAVTPELSVCRAWRLLRRDTDLLSVGQECPCCPGPSWPLPVPGGRPDPGLCPRSPGLQVCAVGFELPAAQSPLCGATARAPLSCSRVKPCAVQPFRELGALSWACKCLLVAQGA